MVQSLTTATGQDLPRTPLQLSLLLLEPLPPALLLEPLSPALLLLLFLHIVAVATLQQSPLL